MFNKKIQLIEWIRLLEAQNYPFFDQDQARLDPDQITQTLKNSPDATLDKLYQRAKMLDAKQSLADLLDQKLDTLATHLATFVGILLLFWFVSGFLGAWALLQSQKINFFYLIVCLLGVHSLMLIFGLVRPFLSVSWNASAAKMPFLARFFAHAILPVAQSKLTQDKSSPLHPSLLHLYQNLAKQAKIRWYFQKISHQLWLVTLLGSLLAIVILFLVRQYHFAWESTLLSTKSLVTLVEGFGWLPHKFGFDLPYLTAVHANSPDKVNRQWASLLIGSVLLYGIVPRALFYWFCAWKYCQTPIELDLSLPYYQKILKEWQKNIVDPDDFSQNLPVLTPKLSPKKSDQDQDKISNQGIHSKQKCLIALLEYPHADWIDPKWVFEDCGILQDRADLNAFLHKVETLSLPVVIGVSLRSLPDRGNLRILVKIAQNSLSFEVRLLKTGGASDDQRLQQWRTALVEQGLLFVEG